MYVQRHLNPFPSKNIDAGHIEFNRNTCRIMQLIVSPTGLFNFLIFLNDLLWQEISECQTFATQATTATTIYTLLPRLKQLIIVDFVSINNNNNKM